MKLRDLSKERREEEVKTQEPSTSYAEQLPTKKENKGKRKQAIINKNYGRKWHVENTASKLTTLANKQNYIL